MFTSNEIYNTKVKNCSQIVNQYNECAIVATSHHAVRIVKTSAVLYYNTKFQNGSFPQHVACTKPSFSQ